MAVVVFAILLALALAAASRWGADSRPRIDDYERWWPGSR
jgi:hypothetical protein